MAGAVLSYPGSTVRLSWLDDPYYVLVEIESDLGKASKNVYSIFLDTFVPQLESIYASLNGQAEVDSLEGDFVLQLISQPRGYFEVSAQLLNFDRSSRFETRFKVDQTYLPKFIRNLRSLGVKSVHESV